MRTPQQLPQPVAVMQNVQPPRAMVALTSASGHEGDYCFISSLLHSKSGRGATDSKQNQKCRDPTHSTCVSDLTGACRGLKIFSNHSSTQLLC